MFILAIILAVIASIPLIIGKVSTQDGDFHLRPIGSGILAVGVVFLILSCLTSVAPRNYGIVTSFGKPQGEALSNGIHFKAPWEHITDIDGAYDTQKFVGDKCIDVRIDDGTTACVSVVIQSRINREAATEVYVDYRNGLDGSINANLNDSLVRTQLTQAVAHVFAPVNPLLNAVTKAATKTNNVDQSSLDYGDLSKSVSTDMNTALETISKGGPKYVDVKSITITFVKFSDVTQNKINQLQVEVANTRVAEQKRLTAAAEAAANRTLASSVSHDPNVLVSKCLDLAGEGKIKIPNFQCMPNTNGATPVYPVK